MALAVPRYLESVRENFPAEYAYIAAAASNLSPWRQPPSIIALVPFAAFKQQELRTLDRFIDLFGSIDEVQSGAVALLLFGNCPENEVIDEEIEVKRSRIMREIPSARLFCRTVPRSLGRTDGPYIRAQSLDQNRVPIGFIRDTLSIASMLLWQRTAGAETRSEPLLLQMDIDFEGLERGSFSQIIDQFNRNPRLQFLQCTSDWDSAEYPTASDPYLALGARLMRELPQILKRPLADDTILEESFQQLVFGGGIQRGIQVPQVERMSSVAGKGGNGLLRMSCDELDLNLRMSALSTPRGLGNAEDVVFLWNNRRAVAAWTQFGVPPLAQWTISFTSDDWVRTTKPPARPAETTGPVDQLMVVKAINSSLARFPLPPRIPGVYENPSEAISEVLRTIGLSPDSYDASPRTNPRGAITYEITQLRSLPRIT